MKQMLHDDGSFMTAGDVRMALADVRPAPRQGIHVQAPLTAIEPDRRSMGDERLTWG